MLDVIYLLIGPSFSTPACSTRAPATGSEMSRFHDAQLLAGRDRHGRPVSPPGPRAGPAREIQIPGKF